MPPCLDTPLCRLFPWRHFEIPPGFAANASAALLIEACHFHSPRSANFAPSWFAPKYAIDIPIGTFWCARFSGGTYSWLWTALFWGPCGSHALALPRCPLLTCPGWWLTYPSEKIFQTSSVHVWSCLYVILPSCGSPSRNRKIPDSGWRSIGGHNSPSLPGGWTSANINPKPHAEEQSRQLLVNPLHCPQVSINHHSTRHVGIRSWLKYQKNMSCAFPRNSQPTRWCPRVISWALSKANLDYRWG